MSQKKGRVNPLSLQKDGSYPMKWFDVVMVGVLFVPAASGIAQTTTQTKPAPPVTPPASTAAPAPGTAANGTAAAPVPVTASGGDPGSKAAEVGVANTAH